MSAAVVEAALLYHARGWVPVRVDYRGKNPIGGSGWQKMRPTEDEIATWGECNAGVLLGSASGGLTDIDLDCAEAVALAPYYLPPTWVFGRASKPRSHWLYICDGAHTRKFSGIDDKAMLEIRSDASTGPGHQTVMPPSVHVSGEAIEWDPDYCDGTEGPRAIAHAELTSCVAKLARGVLFMQLGASVEEARVKVAAYRPPPKPRPVQPRKLCSSADVVDRARKYLSKMDASISGSFGHNALFKAALMLVKGFNLDEAAAIDLLEAEFNPRCQPAWRRQDLERKVKEASDKSTASAGYLVDCERRGM